jgi:hypothetical protein
MNDKIADAQPKAAVVPAPAPSIPRPDKAILLGAFYQYLGGRIDSVGRRASFTMALIASFLGFVSSPIVRGESTMAAKWSFVLAHPSLLIAIVAMLLLLAAEIARIKPSDDLLTRIAFSNDDPATLRQAYADASAEELFGEMIKNARIVGGFLRKKVVMYDVGAGLFVLAAILYVFGF